MTRQDARDFLKIAHDLHIRPNATIPYVRLLARQGHGGCNTRATDGEVGHQSTTVAMLPSWRSR
jgi:hypothetical protein